ncbi:PREDICTED: uncharacterized protein LOC105954475 [Erythranthe guttata]|uniref:uncharacterized protein LOC105954475 n=1 Tax=Erythranthe guttata TaxID=4155 RepID=UPI00064DDCBD|nr:PREDICTED: uncharacterized protein LOC105954475 [Erythranthe guttata]|eukprot:XP_012833599.1 PREDICTED: uncharacterized protein LOC105954475 [Erythranthe guttata]
MGILDSLSPPKPIFSPNSRQAHLFTPTPSPKFRVFAAKKCNLTTAPKKSVSTESNQSSKAINILIGAAGITIISLVGPTHAAESSSLFLNEPSNALSLPTWAVHVSSVVEWATAMGLVWQYGEKSGYESWKGLSWGMVPLLGGALCACTWHFFYNSESLEVRIVIVAALTLIGNATMCIAAYRIYVSSQKRSENS